MDRGDAAAGNRIVSNALIRIITAVVAAPVLIGAVYLGGVFFGVFVAALAVAGQHELYVLQRGAGHRPYVVGGLLLGVGVAFQPLVPELGAAVVAGAFVLAIYHVFAGDDRAPFDALGSTFLGLLYPVYAFTFVVHLRATRGPGLGDVEAFWLVLSVFLMIWATDILAYYTGRSIGKHPLAPTISPKKTWEGAIGGAVGALLAAVALKVTVLGFLAWPHVVVMALVCGIVSQLGDLTESKMKRSADIKDSGKLLPGHGGVLDRFDALLFAAPLVYLYLLYVARIGG